MKCPACRESMLILELERVEIDYCVACGGIWLDGGELEILLKQGVRSDLLLDSLKPGDHRGEKRRKCPSCHKSMKKNRAILQKSCAKGPIVDNCERGHGMWLDRGELEVMLKMAGVHCESPTIHLLQHIFKKFDSKGD